MKKILFFCLMITVSFLFIISATLDGKNVYFWTMDDEKEIKTYGDDNTKTKFALETKIIMQGKGSCLITPSGEAIETKLALDLSKKDIKQWVKSNIVNVNVYLPKENKMNPKEFFLGMGDVSTKKFVWVDGVFFTKMDIKPGWNTVSFELLPKMKALKQSKKYRLFVVFIGRDKDNVKTPLTEKFIVDGLYTVTE